MSCVRLRNNILLRYSVTICFVGPSHQRIFKDNQMQNYNHLHYLEFKIKLKLSCKNHLSKYEFVFILFKFILNITSCL